jgi:hypothetical protein
MFGLQLDGRIKGSTLIQYRTSHILTVWTHINIYHPFLGSSKEYFANDVQFFYTSLSPARDTCPCSRTHLDYTTGNCAQVAELSDDMLYVTLISYIFSHSSVNFQTAVFWRMFQGSCDIWEVCTD